MKRPYKIPCRITIYIVVLAIFILGVRQIDLIMNPVFRKVRVEISFSDAAQNEPWDPRVGSPSIKMHLANLSDKPITVDWRAPELADVRFELRKSFFQTIPMHEYTRYSTHRGPPDRVVILPYETRSLLFSYVLYECGTYASLKDGVYTLTCNYTYNGVVYRSNSLDITLMRVAPVLP
jgi:hypothetical protein